MDRLQSWARMELECRQVRTIDEAITQAEALTDFRHEKPDRAKGDDMRGIMTMVGEIVAKARRSVHVLRIITVISLMARSLYVMMTQRKRQRLPKEVVPTYAVACMARQGALN